MYCIVCNFLDAAAVAVVVANGGFDDDFDVWDVNVVFSISDAVGDCCEDMLAPPLLRPRAKVVDVVSGKSMPLPLFRPLSRLLSRSLDLRLEERLLLLLLLESWCVDLLLLLSPLSDDR